VVFRGFFLEIRRLFQVHFIAESLSVVRVCRLGTSRSGPVNMSDPTSYANFEEISTKELNLNLEVDFNRKILKGVVTFLIEAHANTSTLVGHSWEMASTRLQ